MHLLADASTTWVAISAGAAFFLAVVTALFVWAAFGQLDVLKQTQTDTTKAADAASRAAAAAEESATAAREQARQAAEQVVTAQEQLKLARDTGEETLHALREERRLSVLPSVICSL